MISRTMMKDRVKRKTNPVLVQAIRESMKHKTWSSVSKIISGSSVQHSSLNLFQIDSKTKEGDTVVIPGKVLSNGTLTKKIVICALSISEGARAKLKETKSEFVSLVDEIKKNPKAEGVKILR